MACIPVKEGNTREVQYFISAQSTLAIILDLKTSHETIPYFRSMLERKLREFFVPFSYISPKSAASVVYCTNRDIVDAYTKL
jgi:hypothetical protein